MELKEFLQLTKKAMVSVVIMLDAVTKYQEIIPSKFFAEDYKITNDYFYSSIKELQTKNDTSKVMKL